MRLAERPYSERDPLQRRDRDDVVRDEQHDACQACVRLRDRHGQNEAAVDREVRHHLQKAAAVAGAAPPGQRPVKAVEDPDTLPYVVVVLAGAFSRERIDLEEAAATVGAGPLQRLALVSLPASRVALATAAVMALIVSWSQYGTTLAIGGETTPLPVMLVPFAQSDPQVAATLAILFLAPTLVALGAIARPLRR